MPYHVLVSLFSMEWWPSACRGENETPNLNPTGKKTNLIFVYFDHLKTIRVQLHWSESDVAWNGYLYFLVVCLH